MHLSVTATVRRGRMNCGGACLADEIPRFKKLFVSAYILSDLTVNNGNFKKCLQ